MPDDDTRAEAERQHGSPDGSLAVLLERNKSGFADSRYLFEKAKPEVSCFIYDHVRLTILCSILCEGLEQSLQAQGQQPRYKRHFQFEIGRPIPSSSNYSNKSSYAQ